MFGIHRQAARAFARIERPVVQDGQPGRVDPGDLALILEVDIDMPFTIGDGKLGRSAEFYAADHLAGLGIEHSRRRAALVEGKDPVRCGIINDCVRVGSSLCLSDFLKSLQIVNSKLAIAAIAGK